MRYLSDVAYSLDPGEAPGNLTSNQGSNYGAPSLQRHPLGNSINVCCRESVAEEKYNKEQFVKLGDSSKCRCREDVVQERSAKGKEYVQYWSLLN